MKKKAQKEAKGAKTPKQTPARERTSITVAAHQLRPAPWNPRPEITSESVADITASLPKVGLIHPLVVMRDPDKPSVKGVDFYVIISGHRRFKACLDAGYRPIPCDLVDVDVATAKQMTIIENLQRRDADPLLESELVKSLLDDGMTQAEIAAETGRGERWVARRANLRKLSPSWRKRVTDGQKITVDCLEHIAAYPEEIQEKCKEADYYSESHGTGLTWASIRYQFLSESRDLGEVLFDAERCLHCPNNTGCVQDLFDDDGKKLGRCLDATCYARLTQKAIDEAVAKARKNGREVVNKKPYNCGVYNTTKKPTKKNTALYVYKDYNGNKTLEYGEPPPEKDEEAETEKAKRRKLIDKAREEACEKFEEWIEAQQKRGIWPKWFVDAAIDYLIESIDAVRWGVEKAVDAFTKNTSFTASDAETDAAYKEFLAKNGEVKADEDEDEGEDRK